MKGGIGEIVFGGSALIVLGAVGAYRWVRQLRTAAQVRARSQDPADNFEDELGLWLSQRLTARWLIESAHNAATATMRIEAIEFYNELAVRWNDEMGWAERKLIPTAASIEQPSLLDQPDRLDQIAS
jgi:hypothetical protein